MSLLNFLSPKAKKHENPVHVDMHSHLIPGIDDGSQSLEESISLVKELQRQGFKKIITTPHIMGDFFKNTPETILGGLDTLRTALHEESVDVQIEAAAEYYLDESLVKRLEGEETLLTFGSKNYLLFETSYVNRPPQLEEVIFAIASSGMIPVLAHPERYIYLYNDFEDFVTLFDRGVLFQLNTNSLAGYYSKAAQKFARKLIDEKMVHFIGTDCHGARHLEAHERAMSSKHYGKLADLDLLNNTLI